MDNLTPNIVSSVLKNFSFVEEISNKDIICTFCKNLLNNAYSAPCGCRYCYKCISNYLGDNKKLCPGNTEDCKSNLIGLKDNVFVDNCMNNKISRLIVKCPEKSCDFKDEFRNIKNHFRICNATNSDRILQCPYSRIGCNISEIIDTNLNEHLQNATGTHATLLMDFIDNINNETNTLKEIISKLKKENDSLNKNILERNLIVEKYQIELNRINHDMELLKISKSDENIKEIRIQELENKYEQLNKQFSEINNNYQQIRTNVLTTKQEIEKERNLMRNIDEKEKENDKTMQNMQLKLLEIEALQSKLNYGEFVWRIDEFNNKLKDAKNGIITKLSSNTFYSHKHGYKMCLKIYPNGWAGGKGTHLSIYFCLMKGEYDDILEWPFKFLVTCSLINQQTRFEYNTGKFECYNLSNCIDLNKPNSMKNNGLGFPNFIKLQDLLNNKDLIFNDQIFVKCTVTVLS